LIGLSSSLSLPFISIALFTTIHCARNLLCDFVIKKTKSAGGQPEYNKSFFAREAEPLSVELVEAFDNGDLELYDLVAEAPDATTTADMETWLDTAEVAYAAATRATTSSSRKSNTSDSSGDDDSSDDSPPTKKSNAQDMLSRLKNKTNKS